MAADNSPRYTRESKCRDLCPVAKFVKYCVEVDNFELHLILYLGLAEIVFFVYFSECYASMGYMKKCVFVVERCQETDSFKTI
jgi:hypothetical protein